MLPFETQSRLYCIHYVPSNIECEACRSTESDYKNRPLFAALYVPVPNLPTVLNNSQLKLPDAFYIPVSKNSNDQQTKSNCSNQLLFDDCIELNTNKGLIRVPASTLVQLPASYLSTKNNNPMLKTNSSCDRQQDFPGDFKKHAHRFTRSFSWKTKPEESPYVHMQPLPKLVKRPGYVEMCCKNICWPSHQLCLCCSRNVAESCRKWSKSSGEYDYIDACWSSCALCSDDAYKILNTPVVYDEKIIDPELLLPLDAELLYYSIESAKRQKEKANDFITRPSNIEQSQGLTDRETSTVTSVHKVQNLADSSTSAQHNATGIKSKETNVIPQEQKPAVSKIEKIISKSKRPRRTKSSKYLKNRRSVQLGRKKNHRRKRTRTSSSRSRSSAKRKLNRRKSRSKRKLRWSRSRSKQRSNRSRKRSRRKLNKSKR